MIQNKNQLKKALKENKEGILIKRIYNLDTTNKINVGDVGYIAQVQSNAFTIKYENYDRACWVYYDDDMIEIKDGKIYYYNFVSKNEKERAIEGAEKQGIELIEVLETDRVNKNRMHMDNKFIYKFVVMINEIVEV